MRVRSSVPRQRKEGAGADGLIRFALEGWMGRYSAAKAERGPEEERVRNSANVTGEMRLTLLTRLEEEWVRESGEDEWGGGGAREKNGREEGAELAHTEGSADRETPRARSTPRKGL